MLNFLRLALLLLLIYIIAVIINPSLAPSFVPSISTTYEVGGWLLFGQDKIGHFFLIGFAALASNFLLMAKRFQIGTFSFLWGSVIIAILVTLEELRQVPLATRHFEMFDIFYNFAGIFVFGRIGAWLYKKFK